mmetsp:Transcript_19078/g.64439  ORF Transcript_19078/g.64439 Transcript_19078/m.64439 type:complete len:201 (+) Transcript_19078:2555-3157(+)
MAKRGRLARSCKTASARCRASARSCLATAKPSNDAAVFVVAVVFSKRDLAGVCAQAVEGFKAAKRPSSTFSHLWASNMCGGMATAAGAQRAAQAAWKFKSVRFTPPNMASSLSKAENAEMSSAAKSTSSAARRQPSCRTSRKARAAEAWSETAASTPKMDWAYPKSSAPTPPSAEAQRGRICADLPRGPSWRRDKGSVVW